ncbi:MAG: CAP domain-containing protein [Clostridium sp.]|nr:CAP domain-containing protein [Clostridium sp.]MCM1547874.1 CAP domain-containing protein [Ruminococcus sp.]
MKNILKKIAAAATSTAVLAVSVPFNSYEYAYAAEGVNVNYRTAEEIAEYIKSHPFDFESSEYITEPNYQTAPYSPGKLSDDTLQKALNALNVMRFIAGIDEVELDDNYNECAQAGALVNAANNDLDHKPAQPEGMPDELYQLGYTGTSSSNIGMGHFSLCDDVVHGWMADESDSNMSALGHRRWCLNPSMKKTGFGNVKNYYCMYAFDNAFGSTEYSGVCWPAQVTPVEYFADPGYWSNSNSYPWSYSVGKAVKDPDSVEVTLTDLNSGEVQTFSKATSTKTHYFNVDNANYGKPGCIIFCDRSMTYSAGDKYEVVITESGSEIADYTVSFVNISEYLEEQPQITVADLVELYNYILGRDYAPENIRDYNGDGCINVIDAVYVRRNIIGQ